MLPLYKSNHSDKLKSLYPRKTLHIEHLNCLSLSKNLLFLRYFKDNKNTRKNALILVMISIVILS